MRVYSEHNFDIRMTGHAVHVSWKVAQLPPGLSLVAERDGAPAVGIGGRADQIFTFRADRPGDYEITFALGAPWEAKPSMTQAVTVHVSQLLRPLELD